MDTREWQVVKVDDRLFEHYRLNCTVRNRSGDVVDRTSVALSLKEFEQLKEQINAHK